MPHYAAVEPQGKGLMVASEKPFVFTHVDGRPVELPEPQAMEADKIGGFKGPIREAFGDFLTLCLDFFYSTKLQCSEKLHMNCFDI